jgi:hypothetical protein
MTKNGASLQLTRKSNILNKECYVYRLYFFLELFEGLLNCEEVSSPSKRTSSLKNMEFYFKKFRGEGEVFLSFPE